MFLTPLQRERLKGYTDLAPQRRATFNFRIAEKVSKFLDDVSEVNKTLGVVQFKSSQKAFKPEHIDLVFDLMENALVALDYAPLVPNKEGTLYVYKCIATAPVGGGPVGRYQFTRPATDEEIEQNEHLKKRIQRLQSFTKGGLNLNEFRPPEYFGDMVKDVEDMGHVAFLPGFVDKVKKRKEEQDTPLE